MCVLRYVWHHHWLSVLSFGLFLIVDSYFFAANAVKFFEGAWVAVLIAIFFFVIGFCWYYGQTVLRRYLHVNAQTTALAQLAHRFGSTDESILTTRESEQLTHSRSLPVEHQSASSDEDEEDVHGAGPTVKILPPISSDNTGANRRITFMNDIDDEAFHTDSSENTLCTVTPGLGVFLTTSSRHTPHVFERVLTRIHAVGCLHLEFSLIKLTFSSFHKFQFFLKWNMHVYQ
jgi:hypothetical protein